MGDAGVPCAYPTTVLTDVLGWFILPAYPLGEAAIMEKMLQELGNEVHICCSDYGFVLRHFFLEPVYP